MRGAGYLVDAGRAAQYGEIGCTRADRRQGGRDVVLVGELVGGETGDSGVGAPRVEIRPRVQSVSSRGGQIRALAGDYRQRLGVGHTGQERAALGVRRGELEGGRQGADHVRTLRETGHDPVDGQDLEVLFGQLDHKTQQGVVAFQRSGGDGAVTALLRLVGEGRLVAVVTIGHQERARRDHLRHGLMNARRDDGPELVEGAIVISGTGIIGGTGIVGGTGGAGAGLSRRLWPVRGVPAIWDGP